MNRIALISVASLVALSVACTAPASEEAASSEANQTAEAAPALTVTFTGCTPEFRGQGRSAGELPHDGIDACSEDDGSYNVGGYHLDLLRDGEGSDAALTVAQSLWSERKGDVTLTIPASERLADSRLKVWFGGHASSISVGALPASDSLRCGVRLLGHWSPEAGAYAKHTQLDCVASGPATEQPQAQEPAIAQVGAGEACSQAAECGDGKVCGVTYACIDGCLGGAIPGLEGLTGDAVKDKREACAHACPNVCRPASLDI